MLLTAVAMFAFAANSIFCRFALKSDSIDPNSFTWIRLTSGASVLALLVYWEHQKKGKPALVPSISTPDFYRSWPSAVALLVYALGFSWAYQGLSSASGALLLFGTVQITMIGYGLLRGEKLSILQYLGFIMACAGLLWFLFPSANTPKWVDAFLMVLAGVAWAVYSLRGKSVKHPVTANRQHFSYAAALATPVFLATWLLGDSTVGTNMGLTAGHISAAGVWLALASGVLASGLGYAIWYAALPALRSTQAATVQLSVPVITAVLGALFLGEWLSLEQTLACAVVLLGIALVQVKPNTPKKPIQAQDH